MQSIHFRQIGTSIYQGPKRTPSLSMLLFALLLFTVLSLGIFFFSIDDWEVFSHIVLPITLIMLLFVAFFVFVILRIFSPRVKVDLQQHTISIPNPGTWISLLMNKVKAFRVCRHQALGLLTDYSVVADIDGGGVVTIYPSLRTAQASQQVADELAAFVTACSETEDLSRASSTQSEEVSRPFTPTMLSRFEQRGEYIYRWRRIRLGAAVALAVILVMAFLGFRYLETESGAMYVAVLAVVIGLSVNLGSFAERVEVDLQSGSITHSYFGLFSATTPFSSIEQFTRIRHMMYGLIHSGTDIVVQLENGKKRTLFHMVSSSKAAKEIVDDLLLFIEQWQRSRRNDTSQVGESQQVSVQL
ncbi:MAG: hypothetical protein ACFNUE_03385 [Bacteroides sp.]